MPLRKNTTVAPLLHQDGDQYARSGNSIQQIRGGSVIATQPIARTEKLTVSDHVGPRPTSVFYEEYAVATAKTLTNVEVLGSGTVRITFNDNQVELSGGHTEGVQVADQLDANGQLAESIIIAKMYRHSPDGTALDDAIGSSVPIDSIADTPIVFTPSNGLE